jgi:hypothetical protein
VDGAGAAQRQASRRLLRHFQLGLCVAYAATPRSRRHPAQRRRATIGIASRQAAGYPTSTSTPACPNPRARAVGGRDAAGCAAFLNGLPARRVSGAWPAPGPPGAAGGPGVRADRRADGDSFGVVVVAASPFAAPLCRYAAVPVPASGCWAVPVVRPVVGAVGLPAVHRGEGGGNPRSPGARGTVAAARVVAPGGPSERRCPTRPR